MEAEINERGESGRSKSNLKENRGGNESSFLLLLPQLYFYYIFNGILNYFMTYVGERCKRMSRGRLQISTLHTAQYTLNTAYYFKQIEYVSVIVNCIY